MNSKSSRNRSISTFAVEAQSPFKGAEAALHAAASQATGGLDDFGDTDSYMPGLEQLLDALDNDGPRFTPEGHAFVQNTLIGVLISRLLAEQGWKERPDCLDRPISKPLVIMGLPRTGTTAIHKLLSVDPQFQGLDRWLTAFPMPRPPREAWPENPRYQACVQGLEEFFASAPEMRAAHDMRADDVDECLEVLKQNFCSNYFGSSFRVPHYDAWCLGQSEAPSYRRYYQVMQLIGADTLDQTWLLKNPGHVTTVDLLLDIFPDACVVQTHRDPVVAVPSLCSVLHQARGIVEGNAVDPGEIGARELNYWSHALDDADQKRALAPERFLDVHQSDIHRRPLEVVRRIYDKFGFKLTESVEASMRERIDRNPEGSHGEHRYTLETFGLTEDSVRERFQGYMQRHLMDDGKSAA